MTGVYMPLSRSQSTSEAIHSAALLVSREQSVLDAWLYERLKRALDIVLSCFLLLLFGPLMLLIAVIIKLDTPGPALYVQRRVGKGGHVFRFHKFRSMFNDTDHTVAHRRFSKEYINGNHSAAQSNHQNDLYKPPGNGSSITPVGHWLRKYSLDELPQLINVIKGDMSLVGPRPSMDYEVEECADWHLRRLDVVPGITGLAQINGRSTLSFDDIMRFDIHYIENRSLWMDLRILLKTAPVVLLAHGAS